MKRYINNKTGAIIDSSFTITGTHWELYKRKTVKEELEYIEEVEELEDIEEVEELEEELDLSTLNLEELKEYADSVGTSYPANIGYETLLNKFTKGE